MRTVNDRDEHAFEVDHDPGEEPDTPLSDEALLDLLDALVNDRGPTGAAEALGVNYRTVARCRQSRRVSKRIRQVLVEFRDAQDVGGDGPGVGSGESDGTGDDPGESPEHRAAQLERENRELRETVEAQAVELEALRRRVAELGQQAGEDHAVHGGQGLPEQWRPPGHGPGLPDAGVVTLDEQPDEAHAFGPAVPLVAEWRKLRAGCGQVSSRVDRAVCRVRHWKIEVDMPRDWHLTLPPEKDPLDESWRKDPVRWRWEALAEAWNELGRAERARLLKRMATLGFWQK